MKREPLQKRLAWLENNHADDPAFWIRRVLKIRHTTMGAYFFDCHEYLHRLSQILGLSEEAMENMTYEQAIQRIAALAQIKEKSEDASSAVWLLAIPYYINRNRRQGNNG